jgi:hypothetical protein
LTAEGGGFAALDARQSLKKAAFMGLSRISA